MPDFRDVALGKREPKHDPRTFKLARYLDTSGYRPPAAAAVPGYTPPSSRHWDAAITGSAWGMLGNDNVGDCTCATVGHMTQAWRANDEGISPSTVTAEDALALYSAITGYDPHRPDTDQGAYCLDVLNYWRKRGIGTRPAATAFVQVDLKNTAEVKAAVDLFGGLYLGLSLPASAQRQAVWSAPVCRWCPRSRPGSWGGHAVPIVAYSSSRLWCVTWAQTQPMTWGFLRRYGDEGYAVLHEDWVGADALAPVGFDFARLQSDLTAL